MKHSDRDYSVRADFPDFEAIDDGCFQCLALTLDDGRYVVMTNRGGMGYPEFDDFMVCVYTSEDAFGDDPSTSLLACLDSQGYDDIEDAVLIAMGEEVDEYHRRDCQP